MEKNAARELVKGTLQNPFNRDRFIYFVKNLLNHIDESKAFHARGYVKEKFKQAVPVVKTYERVGTYTDAEGKKIDVLIVYLVKNNSLDRARTTLRNFAADYLKQRDEKDAGLVAFVSPDHNDWRLSLVKMEYKITESPTGKIKAKEEFTPAKRYSFLVGEHETSHTAQSRLVPIIEDDINDPTLKQLEDAFNIEKVTKEFFEKYRDLFVRVKESLDDLLIKNKIIKDDFVGKGINTVDFAKKLLGQIVFLYFLQKKGWFGVSKGKDWGEGDKKFLRNLFIRAENGEENYFNKFLEPLFYEALRLERPKDYYDQFNCRIPFLNGGLFDPISDYDWQDTDIEIPNDIFSNDRKTKEGDTGDGILDIFDRYNFTVKEDEPLEKEVAVDPEMLGKVFENLLEVKDSKSKGTYYTPREIVHYMCQESLVNYLATELEGKVKKEEVETLIKYGETSVEHDTTYIKKKSKDANYKGRYGKAKLPRGIRQNAKLIDEKLASIRVCDPAVGSGAFPVGMMNEIIRTRNVLTPYMGEDSERTSYNFKRHAIQNSLYGVDIDLGAVEIAKLRLWLSLIVDEEDIKQIKPLPNLDYKIMQGNSLIEILTPELLMGTTDQDKNELIKQVKKAKDELFGISSSPSKDEKRKEIESLLARIIEHDRRVATRNLKIQIVGIKSQGKLFTDKRIEDAERKQILALEQKFQEIKNLKLPGPAEHFEWRLNFSEVFHEKDGFDVVIANPPYVENKKIPGKEKEQYKLQFDSAYKLYDLSVLFMEESFRLLKDRGVMVFITTNKFLATDYGIKIRRFLLEKTTIGKLIDVSHIRVFKEAAAFPVIISYKKQSPVSKNYVKIYPAISDVRQFETASFNEEVVLQQDFSKNEMLVFNISGYLSICMKVAGANSVPLKTIRHKFLYRPFGFTDWGRLAAKLTDSTDNGLKLIGTPSVFKYHVNWNKKIKIDKVTVLRKFLPYQAKFKDVIQELGNPNILIKEVSPDLTVAFSNGGFGHLTGIYSLRILDTNYDTKYVLALFNSRLINFFYKAYFGTVHLSGGWLKINSSYLELIPIRNITLERQNSFSDLVNKILTITADEAYLENTPKQVKVRDYEKQIDQLVYKLYDLTPEEIKTIENSLK